MLKGPIKKVCWRRWHGRGMGRGMGGVNRDFLNENAIEAAFEKINENQEEINQTCTQGVNNRMHLGHKHEGGPEDTSNSTELDLSLIHI